MIPKYRFIPLVDLEKVCEVVKPKAYSELGRRATYEDIDTYINHYLDDAFGIGDDNDLEFAFDYTRLTEIYLPQLMKHSPFYPGEGQEICELQRDLNWLMRTVDLQEYKKLLLLRRILKNYKDAEDSKDFFRANRIVCDFERQLKHVMDSRKDQLYIHSRVSRTLNWIENALPYLHSKREFDLRSLYNFCCYREETVYRVIELMESYFFGIKPRYHGGIRAEANVICGLEIDDVKKRIPHKPIISTHGINYLNNTPDRLPQIYSPTLGMRHITKDSSPADIVTNMTSDNGFVSLKDLSNYYLRMTMPGTIQDLTQGYDRNICTSMVTIAPSDVNRVEHFCNEGHCATVQKSVVHPYHYSGFHSCNCKLGNPVVGIQIGTDMEFEYLVDFKNQKKKLGGQDSLCIDLEIKWDTLSICGDNGLSLEVEFCFDGRRICRRFSLPGIRGRIKVRHHRLNIVAQEGRSVPISVRVIASIQSIVHVGFRAGNKIWNLELYYKPPEGRIIMYPDILDYYKKLAFNMMINRYPVEVRSFGGHIHEFCTFPPSAMRSILSSDIEAIRRNSFLYGLVLLMLDYNGNHIDVDDMSFIALFLRSFPPDLYQSCFYDPMDGKKIIVPVIKYPEKIVNEEWIYLVIIGYLYYNLRYDGTVDVFIEQIRRKHVNISSLYLIFPSAHRSIIRRFIKWIRTDKYRDYL